MKYETNLEDVTNKKTLNLFLNQPWIPFLSIADSGGNRPSIFHYLSQIQRVKTNCPDQWTLFVSFDAIWGSGQTICQLFGWIIQTQTLKDLPWPPLLLKSRQCSTFPLFTTILLGKEQNRIRKEAQENDKITDKTRRQKKLNKKGPRGLFEPPGALVVVESWCCLRCDIFTLEITDGRRGGEWLARALQSSLFFTQFPPPPPPPPTSLFFTREAFNQILCK